MTIVLAILVFGFLIVIHELGHFITAKLSGVKVNEFAVFMGPAIVKWKKGETLYSIRCIPFGGYCAMEGEDEESDNPRSFQKAAWWKRMIILIAGSAMNFISGVVIIAIVLSCQPRYAAPIIHNVESWSTLGGENGLQANDRIVEFDGKRIDIYGDFTLATAFLADGEYDITVERDGKQIVLENVPMERQLVKYENGTESRAYGITFRVLDTTAKSVPGRIWPTAANHVDSVIVSLKMLFTGKAGLKDMTGPVGIVNMMSDVAESADTTALAILSVLDIGAFLAINLAVMNLLPIPALDGGRVVALLLTQIVEKVTKKKVDPKYEGYIHAAGMVLLLALMAIILFKDIFTIFKG